MRNLDVNGQAWRYNVGVSTTQIRGPRGETWNVGTHDVNGRTPSDLERGRHKKTSDGMVTPADVRRYITRRLGAAKET